MYKFIRITSEKIFSMFIAFVITGIVYLLILGISEGFMELVATGIGNMFIMAWFGIIIVSPAVIFIGIPFSFLANYIGRKVSKHQAAIRLGLYIVLALLIALITNLVNVQGIIAKFVLPLGLASGLGFWSGELLYSKIIKILKEKKIIKFSINELN
ncbi:hypothetical protein [Bacillus sp. JJ722]|uniref:hypothetical protein n=1 Tax=Bacillus sp. JJ722 TaxID=3122973 RepID=UPI002FFE6F78